MSLPYEGPCQICGRVTAVNEGICASHSDEVAQAYLFGFADGKQATRPSQEASTKEGWRPKVVAFASLMELKLRENDHKGGWENEGEDYLLKRLRQEVEELAKACDQWGKSPKSRRPEVGREAADVANFAMMLADIYKALPAPPALAAPADKECAGCDWEADTSQYRGPGSEGPSHTCHGQAKETK